MFGKAPQHEIPAGNAVSCLFGDRGKSETERRRPVAVGFRLDLVKPPSFQRVRGPCGVILRGSACASHLRMTFRNVKDVILRRWPKAALEG